MKELQFAEFYYYDSGHGRNIVNDCLIAIEENGVQMDEFPYYECRWNKIESCQGDTDYLEELSVGLSTYSNTMKIEDNFLLGECFSIRCRGHIDAIIVPAKIIVSKSSFK